MLNTPLGKIRILKNQKEVDYTPLPHNVDFHAIKEKPLAGCYRINIDFEQNDTISCELISTYNLEKENSSGEDYACKTFSKDNIELTIGAYDKIENNICACDYINNGLLFENLTYDTNKIVFGISWVLDLYPEDNRTWLASDPTLDNK